MNQKRMPLFDKLINHAHSSPESFHVPGHKNGRVFLDNARNEFANVLSLDQTEIKGLDDLHEPSGIIREAEELTADLYGAMTSYFLVGGSTVGNIAMIMTVARRGETVLVQRNSHQSIFNGLELVGVQPVFLEPDWDKETGLSLGVSSETLRAAVWSYPDAVAVLLTNPTYEGYGQPLAEHVRVAHDGGLIVCVDEAHGAHLIIDENPWPRCALKAGADLVVQSAHKTLPAMTMASYLHRNSKDVDEEKLRLSLRMLQSSSPSYPLMASLDVARAYLAGLASEDWQEIKEKTSELKIALAEGKGWSQVPRTTGSYLQDPLKLVFVTDYSGVPFQWKARMEEEGCYPELVSPHHLLLTLPLAASAFDVKKWIRFFRRLLELTDEDISKREKRRRVHWQRDEIVTQMELSFDEINRKKTLRVPWSSSNGYVSAETITPYPPGIPILLKGERIREYHLLVLTKLVKERVSFQTGTSWIENGIRTFL